MKQSKKPSIEETLMYYSEILKSRRAIKSQLLMNAYFSIFLMSGIFYIFDSRYPGIFGKVLPACIILGIGIFSSLLIHSNKLIIQSLKSKERGLVAYENLKLAKKYWVGIGLHLDNKEPNYWAYFSVVSMTALIYGILLLMRIIWK